MGVPESGRTPGLPPLIPGGCILEFFRWTRDEVSWLLDVDVVSAGVQEIEATSRPVLVLQPTSN